MALFRPTIWLAVMVWGSVLTGCAGQPPATPLESPHAKAHRLAGVPFYPDNTDQCGPATLASVLSFWGARTEPRMLKEEVYVKGLRGSLPTDLLFAATSRGFEAHLHHGTLQEIKDELNEGHPVVVLLNLGYPLFPIGHYVVVTGYDDGGQGMYVHSGLNRDTFLTYGQFQRSWDKAGRWLLLIVPGGLHARKLT